MGPGLAKDICSLSVAQLHDCMTNHRIGQDSYAISTAALTCDWLKTLRG